MSPTDYTDDVIELLDLFDGVSVRTHQLTSVMLNIYLNVDNFQSLYELYHCTEGANVRFHAYTCCNPRELKDFASPAQGIEHCLAFSDADNFESLLIFGVFLVWRLYANQKLNKEEANYFLALWGGASIEQKFKLT